MKVVYHKGLTFGSRFLNLFHPFEFDRAERAAALIRERLGSDFDSIVVSPAQPVELSDLALVHDERYLDALGKGSTIARVVEVPFLSLFPRSWLDGWFLTPARWSVACTVFAAQAALSEGFALSLGGGFHHAKRHGGEGFCLVNDVAYAIETLRRTHGWGNEEKLLYLDLDVHQGNGVSDYYQDDAGVRILDLYNQEIYPVYGERLPQEWAKPLPTGCDDKSYLEELTDSLDEFVSQAGAKLLIYNAGTDVFEEDRLGGFKLTRNGVRIRDLHVIKAAKRAGLPLLVLASGGYSKASAELLADCVEAAYREWN